MNEVPDVPALHPPTRGYGRPLPRPVEPEGGRTGKPAGFRRGARGGRRTDTTGRPRRPARRSGSPSARFQSASAPRPTGQQRNGPAVQRTETEPGGASSPSPRPGDAVEEPGGTARLAEGGTEGTSPGADRTRPRRTASYPGPPSQPAVYRDARVSSRRSRHRVVAANPTSAKGHGKESRRRGDERRRPVPGHAPRNGPALRRRRSPHT